MPVLTLVLLVASAGLLCFLLLTGLGLLAQELLRLEPGPLEAFITGWGIFIGVLELYHLFRPIDSFVSGVAIALALLGLALQRQKLRRTFGRLRARHITGVAFSALLIFLIALRSTGPCVHYDTGLYGASAIDWLTSYRVVPGLANLHGRLGFNSSVFFCIAVLQALHLGAISYRVWDGLLLAVVSVLSINAITRILVRERNRPSDGFLAVLAIPLISYVGYSQLVGADTDLPATLACFLAGLLLLRDLESEDEPAASRQTTLVAGTFISAIAVLTKFSTIVFAGACCVLCVWRLYSLRRTAEHNHRAMYGCFVLLASLFGGGICTNYVESGYPLYPNDFLGLHADWAVPRSSVRLLAAIIKSWARVPFVARYKTAGWRWVNVWIIYARQERIPFWAPLIAVGVATSLLMLMARKSKRSALDFWPILLSCAVSVAAWFYLAPDLRFVQGPVWVLAATLGGLVISEMSLKHWHQIDRVAVVAILALTIYYSYPHVLWQQFNEPMQARNGDQLFPSITYGTYRTRSGLLVQVPLHGDQCWDAPLPCTPYFNDKLELRDPPSLRSGFRSADFVELQWLPYR
ncbi:MAG TPA: hypothetical protein VMB47_03825 [Candidatus Aquilonibacter sp.]|nr:hypothetical protein [Candidatus Aquilonibacter sp.]